MKWLVAASVLVAVLVPAAYATVQASDPRVPALKRQVAALNARVAQLENDVDAVGGSVARVQVFARCEAANQQPLAEYFADVAAREGGQWYHLSFLDYSGGDPPHGFVPFPPRPCVVP